MRLYGVGDSWPPTYAFDQLQGEDTFNPTRPPIVQQVSGMDGAFDFFGDQNYAVAPFTIARTYRIEADDYGDVADKLNDLRKATIAAGLVKLWAEKRGGTSTRFWTLAKCVALRVTDSYKEKSSSLPVELQFYCSEGVWHGSTQRNYSFNDGEITGAGTYFIEQGGNYRTPFELTVSVSGGGSMTSFRLDNLSTGEWIRYTGTVADGTDLVIDTGLFSVLNDGVDGYADFEWADGTIQWMRISGTGEGTLPGAAIPGSNEIDFTVTRTGSVAAQFLYYDSELL